MFLLTLNTPIVICFVCFLSFYVKLTLLTFYYPEYCLLNAKIVAWIIGTWTESCCLQSGTAAAGSVKCEGVFA